MELRWSKKNHFFGSVLLEVTEKGNVSKQEN
jgi:hypothetical protein